MADGAESAAQAARRFAQENEQLRAVLRDLTADTWAGWVGDSDIVWRQCFYCDALTTDRNPHRHKPDCPLLKARVLLGTQPDVATEEA